MSDPMDKTKCLLDLLLRQIAELQCKETTALVTTKRHLTLLKGGKQ